MICFLSFLIHVATYMKSWISLHWPCKSHALFLCAPTLLSSSSFAHTFPLSLFGAGLPLQVIGGRGATGRAAQEKNRTLFFRGQILDTFLRGPQRPNGSILEVKMRVDFDQNVTKNASETRWRFSVDFWSISGASKPWKWWFRISETLFFIKSLFRKSYPKRWWKWRQNAPKTVPETLERSTKKRVENVDRFFIDFDWFGPPKRRSKKWCTWLFWDTFSALGATWLQKGALGRSDPIFGAFLMILDRFLRNMFNVF